MERKVNKVGINTLTVSLPSKWTENNNIEKGDSLDVIEDKNSITFSKGQDKKKIKKGLIFNFKRKFVKIKIFMLIKRKLVCRNIMDLPTFL